MDGGLSGDVLGWRSESRVTDGDELERDGGARSRVEKESKVDEALGTRRKNELNDSSEHARDKGGGSRRMGEDGLDEVREFLLVKF